MQFEFLSTHMYYMDIKKIYIYIFNSKASKDIEYNTMNSTLQVRLHCLNFFEFNVVITHNYFVSIGPTFNPY